MGFWVGGDLGISHPYPPTAVVVVHVLGLNVALLSPTFLSLAGALLSSLLGFPLSSINRNH